MTMQHTRTLTRMAYGTGQRNLITIYVYSYIHIEVTATFALQCPFMFLCNLAPQTLSN